MGLGSLFGTWFGSGESSVDHTAAESIDYNGYAISATPMKEGGQYRTAGTISKEIDGEVRLARFIRADNHADRDSAVAHAERKAQQIIDEQGDALFDRSNI